MSKSEAKAVFAAMKVYANKLKKAEVTEGYELDCVVSISGDEDEDEEKITLMVYKINGRWTTWEMYTILQPHFYP